MRVYACVSLYLCCARTKLFAPPAYFSIYFASYTDEDKQLLSRYKHTRARTLTHMYIHTYMLLQLFICFSLTQIWSFSVINLNLITCTMEFNPGQHQKFLPTNTHARVKTHTHIHTCVIKLNSRTGSQLSSHTHTCRHLAISFQK